jgi:pathogenesis-related protein 1
MISAVGKSIFCLGNGIPTDLLAVLNLTFISEAYGCRQALTGLRQAMAGRKERRTWSDYLLKSVVQWSGCNEERRQARLFVVPRFLPMMNLKMTESGLFNRIFLAVLAALMLNGASCAKKPRNFPALIPSSLQSSAFDEDGARGQAGSGLSPGEKRQLLLEHTRVRAEVGVGPLVWSERLADHARQWAEHLAAAGCRLEHRPATGPWAGPYGENLFSGTIGYYGVADAVQAWESEKRFFQGEALTSSNWQPAGHYTQLVWKNTRKVGCGKAVCQGRILIVCNYDPPGNVLGEKPY